MGRTYSRCPVTVDVDRNPFPHRPEDLRGDTWYLVYSDGTRDSEAGSWKPKGEPRQVTLMGSPVFCWETIRVFCEGDAQETDWIMIQYTVPVPNETASICRIGKAPYNQIDNPFHSDDFQNSTNNCPFLTAVNQEATRIMTEGDFLALEDLEGPLFPTGD